MWYRLGTCTCPPLFGATDCSLNVTIPPEIFGIEGDGICDVSQMSCDQILVAGDDFTETETYHCKIDVTHVRSAEACLDVLNEENITKQYNTLYNKL